MNEIISKTLRQCQEALENLSKNEVALRSLAEAGELMARTLENGGRLYSCGNGGSMCDAMHFAEELSGRFRNDRPALGAVAISDPSHLSCVGNDYGYNQVFARFIEGFGKKGDCLLAISTSGKSENVLLAAKKARELGMHVVTLTGKPKSILADIATIDIATEGTSSYADRVQELHIKCIHMLIEMIETRLFGGAKP